MQPPVLIKVHKRSLAELVDEADACGELPKMLCDPCGRPVFYGRLQREGDETPAPDRNFAAALKGQAQAQSDAAGPALATKDLLQDIRENRIKRPRVEAVVARRALAFDLELSEDRQATTPSPPGEGQNNNDANDDYVYYVMTKAPAVCDPKAIALIDVSRLIFEEEEGQEAGGGDSDQWADEDEDSNAEDYYTNDYPDEELADGGQGYFDDDAEDYLGGGGARRRRDLWQIGIGSDDGGDGDNDDDYF